MFDHIRKLLVIVEQCLYMVIYVLETQIMRNNGS